jgi:hypothetical protein
MVLPKLSFIELGFCNHNDSVCLDSCRLEESGDEGTSDEEGASHEGGGGFYLGRGQGSRRGEEAEEHEEDPEEEREVDPLYADLLEKIRERSREDPFEEGV